MYVTVVLSITERSVRKTLYLQNWSQSGTVLTRAPSPVIKVREPLGVLFAELFDDDTERQRLRQGCVSFYRLEMFAISRYQKDVTLALWAWRTLLRDTTYFALRYPKGGIVGRDVTFDVRHILTGQTRQEWLAAGGDVDRLHCPFLWTIGVDSLKSQYHRLYVHEDRADGVNNLCRDGHGHWSYRSSHGPSGQDSQMFSKLQAEIQGVDPCIFAFIHEWVLTWL